MKIEVNNCFKNKQHFRLLFLIGWLIPVIKVSSIFEVLQGLNENCSVCFFLLFSCRLCVFNMFTFVKKPHLSHSLTGTRRPSQR